MILSDLSIRNLIERGSLIENPVDIESSIQPASYDIHLGDQFLSLKPNKDGCIDLKEELKYGIMKVEDGYVTLPSHYFCLAVTKEIISLPDNITATVEGRSSVGRAGLIIQTAGVIDSGFRGTITLELYNCTDYDMRIPVGMRIGQILFFLNDNPSENPYKGKYQHQIDVTGSRLSKDFS